MDKEIIEILKLIVFLISLFGGGIWTALIIIMLKSK